MKLAVTGAGGFIGSHLVRALAAQGHAAATTCLVRNPQAAARLDALGLRVVRGDLRDPRALTDLCRDADVVFHLAARVQFGLGGAGAGEFTADNVEGTRALLEACPPTVRRFLHMSTMNAVERAPGDPCTQPLTEESPCHPQTPYGRSKWQAEQAVRTLAAAKGIPYLIVRAPSLVYGPGCHPASGMATLIRSVAAGSLLTALDFPGRFSLIHVQDLVEATVRLGLATECPNETFFLCQEPPMTIGEIAEAIAAQLGVRRRRVALPRAVYRTASWMTATAMRVPGLARAIPLQLPMVLRDYAAVSARKARTAAGFATRIALADGLRETAPWVLAAEGGPSARR